jgi:hypothetical protein
VIPPAPRWPRFALLGAACLAAAGAAAIALEEPPARRANVDDMDMTLLQLNLLKIYVCGKESTVHHLKMAELKFAIETYGDPAHPKLTAPTEEERTAMEERHKAIFNYMLAEKTNAIQIIHIIDRILGTDVHLAGEGRPERAILEKRIEAIEIPRGVKGKGTEIREAGKMLSEILGCPVRVETIDTEFYFIHFSMERTTGEVVIKHICASVPFDYRIDQGTLIFRHRDLGKPGTRELGKDPPRDGGLGGLDDEEKKAAEDEKNKKR